LGVGAVGHRRKLLNAIAALRTDAGMKAVSPNAFSTIDEFAKDTAEREDHAGNVFGIDPGNTPHVLAPGLEVVFGQASAHSLARETVVLREPDQLTGALNGIVRAPRNWC
jgi:hypothetical protein